MPKRGLFCHSRSRRLSGICTRNLLENYHCSVIGEAGLPLKNLKPIFKNTRMDKQRKIIFCTGIFWPDIGGPAKFVNILSKELIGLGHDVKVITYAESDSVEENIIRVSRNRPKLSRYLKYLRCLLKEARGADFIYAFDIFSVGLPSVVARFFGKAKLLMRLGGDIQWEQAVERGYAGTLRQYYENRDFGLKERIQYLVSSFVLKNVDALIFNSELLRDIYAKQRGVPLERTEIIKNIKPNTVTPGNADVKNRKILFAGRLVGFKNIFNLIKAFSAIDPGKYDGAVLEIVGSGPLEKSLADFIGANRLGERVRLLPAISHEKMMEKYQESEVVAVVSLTEVNSNIVSEAISLRKKILLSRESELYYIGFRGGNAYFADPLDAESIKEGIEAALSGENPEMTADSGEVWNLDRIINKHLELFKRYE